MLGEMNWTELSKSLSRGEASCADRVVQKIRVSREDEDVDGQVTERHLL